MCLETLNTVKDFSVVQHLRLHLPIQGTQVQSPVQEDVTGRGTTEPVATAAEPVNSRAGGHSERNSRATAGESLPPTAARESPIAATKTRDSQKQINTYLKKKINTTESEKTLAPSSLLNSSEAPRHQMWAVALPVVGQRMLENTTQKYRGFCTSEHGQAGGAGHTSCSSSLPPADHGEDWWFPRLCRKTHARVQPPRDPGEPEGKTASADDLERDKERIL